MDSVDYNEKNQYFNELKKLFESKENNPDIILYYILIDVLRH